MSWIRSVRRILSIAQEERHNLLALRDKSFVYHADEFFKQLRLMKTTIHRLNTSGFQNSREQWALAFEEYYKCLRTGESEKALQDLVTRSARNDTAIKHANGAKDNASRFFVMMHKMPEYCRNIELLQVEKEIETAEEFLDLIIRHLKIVKDEHLMAAAAH